MIDEQKKPISKEFWGKDNPIRQRFEPIHAFSVPHMVFPMEDFVKRSDELQQLMGDKLELQSNTDYNTPTDFYNQDEDYYDWKNKLFTNFFAKEIELISKAFFDYMVDTYEN